MTILLVPLCCFSRGGTFWLQARGENDMLSDEQTEEGGRRRMAGRKQKKKHVSPFRIIILGFLGVILLGALLLMLPISTRSGEATPFSQALFTSTSAVCVTGLVVRDTATWWSAFGQAVILLLIQVGGLGVVTVAASFALLSGRKISLLQRGTMQEAISAPGAGGLGRMIGFIVAMTFVVELAGACVMLPAFCGAYGARGVWMAFFHAISAFCNAGFDIMGTETARFSSLTVFRGDVLINVTVMVLIVAGGLGFLTWDDVLTHRHRLRRYRMQSKVILVTTLVLILVPAAIFFAAEMTDLPLGERVLVSLFQAITPRTAGFNTVDLNAMNGAGRVLMTVLMLIGGSPGSTAGGMKTTTVAVLFAGAIAVFRREKDTHFFGRRVQDGAVRHAAAILLLYLTLCIGGGLIISAAEGLPVGACLFETASAVGTVGLTLGITPQLGLLSQCILMVLMFLGRVGGLTLIYAAISAKDNVSSRLPQESISVG